MSASRPARRPRCATSVSQCLSVAFILALYWLSIVPYARREIRRWAAQALRIVDPVCRFHAVESLRSEALNAEAAAAFALLAPLRYRYTITRLTVAYQIMFDFLDTLGEQPEHNAVFSGLELHEALIDALQSPDLSIDFAASRYTQSGSSYLIALVSACRAEFAQLPSGAAVSVQARAAARRCAQAQAHTHAVATSGIEGIRRWAREEGWSERDFLWWELAAAGISSLCVHALLALGAAPSVQPGEVERTVKAYFPPVCALSTLLDSVVDRGLDRVTGNFSYVDQYVSAEMAGERLAAITDQAQERVAELRRRRVHQAILQGVTGFYVSAAQAQEDVSVLVDTTVALLRPGVALVLATLRVRRAFKTRIGAHAG
jgi:tetraprenyl-beta-curcumene synthase